MTVSTNKSQAQPAALLHWATVLPRTIGRLVRGTNELGSSGVDWPAL
jgi:hypothetical protein